jgi:DNA repair ATPase RecN
MCPMAYEKMNSEQLADVLKQLDSAIEQAERLRREVARTMNSYRAADKMLVEERHAAGRSTKSKYKSRVRIVGTV